MHASVRGNDRYHTTIDLESFSAGDCTCSFDKPCRHMAAVIFALYVPHGRPELLVQELKRAMTTKRKSAKNADRESKRRTSEPVPGGSPEDWHRFFEAQYHGFSISHQYSFDLFVTSAFERFQAFASGWPDGIRLLYDLHVNFFVMHRMEQFFGDTKNSYLSGYHESNAKTAAADCLSRLDRLLASPALPVSVKEHPKRWTEALNRLASLALQGKEGPNDWLYAYRAVWWLCRRKRNGSSARKNGWISSSRNGRKAAGTASRTFCLWPGLISTSWRTTRTRRFLDWRLCISAEQEILSSI
ncbi:SWIM zinc finger family protein [Paenibacillus chitinolyticus]|uniref:SWIM zinc finger family protein n=1 Tax=Paenibacillus chitinolyticus TaxID=79263 RepID=UPI001F5067F9|nr:SWIM zinc finger family protein [Paenibacillus chitinolyticus]